MTITSNSKWDILAEENELAFFRADVCLGSPESFSVEEKAAICDDMEATNKAIENAMRSDFQTWSPVAQAKMLDLLEKADPNRFDWWIKTLVGVMPESANGI